MKESVSKLSSSPAQQGERPISSSHPLCSQLSALTSSLPSAQWPKNAEENDLKEGKKVNQNSAEFYANLVR